MGGSRGVVVEGDCENEENKPSGVLVEGNSLGRYRPSLQLPKCMIFIAWNYANSEGKKLESKGTPPQQCYN